jgi:hypothetical protein
MTRLTNNIFLERKSITRKCIIFHYIPMPIGLNRIGMTRSSVYLNIAVFPV